MCVRVCVCSGVCNPGWQGPNCDIPEIKVLHVVQSCHLDVGFVMTAPEIVNLWFDVQYVCSRGSPPAFQHSLLSRATT